MRSGTGPEPGAEARPLRPAVRAGARRTSSCSRRPRRCCRGARGPTEDELTAQARQPSTSARASVGPASDRRSRGSLRSGAMRTPRRVGLAGIVLAGVGLVTAAAGRAASGVALVPVGTYACSNGGVSAGTEIVAFDPGTTRVFSTNGAGTKIDITDVTDPAAPVLVSSINLLPYGTDVRSVAVKNGVVAAAVKGATSQSPGVVAFFDTDGAFIRQATVGALPDSVAFTPDASEPSSSTRASRPARPARTQRWRTTPRGRSASSRCRRAS